MHKCTVSDYKETCAQKWASVVLKFPGKRKKGKYNGAYLTTEEFEEFEQFVKTNAKRDEHQ